MKIKLEISNKKVSRVRYARTMQMAFAMVEMFILGSLGVCCVVDEKNLSGEISDVRWSITKGEGQ